MMTWVIITLTVETLAMLSNVTHEPVIIAPAQSMLLTCASMLSRYGMSVALYKGNTPMEFCLCSGLTYNP